MPWIHVFNICFFCYFICVNSYSFSYSHCIVVWINILYKGCSSETPFHYAGSKYPSWRWSHVCVHDTPPVVHKFCNRIDTLRKMRMVGHGWILAFKVQSPSRQDQWAIIRFFGITLILLGAHSTIWNPQRPSYHYKEKPSQHSHRDAQKLMLVLCIMSVHLLGRGFKSRWAHRVFFNWPNPSSRTRPWGLISL
jgi:hypothetical protein